MKIVHISDTHRKHAQIDMPKGDVLIVSGDFCNSGAIIDLADFNNWLGKLDFKYKIIVAGNHDICFEEQLLLAKSTLTNAIYLEDSEIDLDGIKIYGSPWQPEFCDWAFNLPRGEALREKWDMIPENTDILVTHVPPFGILDKLPEIYTQEPKNVGCEELLTAVKRIKPKYHLFGHIHHSYGRMELDGTVYLNSAICDEQYRPVNKPQVFEVENDI